MLTTRLTQLIGIAHPIQCGTMQWLSRAELVAAVANAGGLACLAAATFPSRQQLRAEIRKVYRLTDQPFGVNVSLFPSLRPQSIETMIQVIADEGVKIIETAGRNPEPYRKRIVSAGLTHIHKCARLRDAAKASQLGVDAVAVVGTECGGHPGMAGVTTLVLAPMAREVVSVPLIVGGGICDGRSLVAALALGADGVVMGTRFLCTRECAAHPEIKKRLVQAEATDTALVLTSLNNPGRMLCNEWARKVVAMEQTGTSLEEMAPLINGQVTCRGWLQGKVDEGLFACGQVVGRIKEVPSVADLMAAILEDAQQAKCRIDGLFAD